MDRRSTTLLSGLAALGLGLSLSACSSAGDSTAQTPVISSTSVAPKDNGSSEVTPSESTSSQPSSSSAQKAPGNAATPRATGSPHVKKGSIPKPSTPVAEADRGNDDKAKKIPSTPPPMPSHPKNQSVILAKLPGTAQQACEAVGTRTDVRSGELAMGNFATARKQYRAAGTKYEQPVVDLYVIPKSRSLKQVSVEMVPFSAKTKSKTITSSEIQTANTWKYYSIHLPVSASGNWKLKVTAGNDHGCFEVAFTH